jgi:hypothetical protein
MEDVAKIKQNIARLLKDADQQDKLAKLALKTAQEMALIAAELRRHAKKLEESSTL